MTRLKWELMLTAVLDTALLSPTSQACDGSPPPQVLHGLVGFAIHEAVVSTMDGIRHGNVDPTKSPSTV